MKELPETLGKAEFARLINRGPSYVTALRKEGRLVMDGDRVKVRESLERMAKTRGARDDVAARWAALAGSEVPEVVPGHESGRNAPAGEPDDGSWRESRAQSEARKSKAQAEQEEMKAAQMRRELCKVEDAEYVVKYQAAAVHSEMEVFPERVASEIVGRNLEEVHEILRERCAEVCARIAEVDKRAAVELREATKT